MIQNYVLDLKARWLCFFHGGAEDRRRQELLRVSHRGRRGCRQSHDGTRIAQGQEAPARHDRHEDVERLLAAPVAVEGPQARRDAALLETLYATGVRVTEFVNLDVGNLDLERRTVTSSMSGKRSRVIPLTPACDACPVPLPD